MPQIERWQRQLQDHFLKTPGETLVVDLRLLSDRNAGAALCQVHAAAAQYPDTEVWVIYNYGLNEPHLQMFLGQY
jgi:hypothetical protein